MIMKRRSVFAVLAAGLLAVGAWAQEKRAASDVEGQIRKAGFQYYISTIFGDPDTHLKVTRMPIQIVRDGALTSRDEKDTRALLAGFAAKIKTANLSDEDRSRIAANILTIFDEASVQFIGANTASITFLTRPAAKEGDGESLATLVLHRKDDRWQVIEEITDSRPVPPSYLVDVPKKP